MAIPQEEKIGVESALLEAAKGRDLGDLAIGVLAEMNGWPANDTGIPVAAAVAQTFAILALKETIERVFVNSRTGATTGDTLTDLYAAAASLPGAS